MYIFQTFYDYEEFKTLRELVFHIIRFYGYDWLNVEQIEDKLEQGFSVRSIIRNENLGLTLEKW